MCCQLCHKGGKPPQGRNQPENDQVDDLYINYDNDYNGDGDYKGDDYDDNDLMEQEAFTKKIYLIINLIDLV